MHLHPECGAAQLTLCFEVHSVNILQHYQDNEAVFQAACDHAKQIMQSPLPGEEATGEQGIPLVQKGYLVVITAGHPLYQSGTSNLVKLHTVE